MSAASSSVVESAREVLRGLKVTLEKHVKRVPRLEAPVRLAIAWTESHPRQAGGLAGAGLLALGAFVWNWTANPGAGRYLVAAVREGTFDVKVLEMGTLQALRSVSYSSTIPGNQAKVVYLAPEGSTVKEGDLLIGLDPTPFAEEVRRAEALLSQARAERIKAEQDVKLQVIQNKEQLTEAADKVRLAELELASVMEGKGKLAEAESAAAVANARRELEKAKAKHEDLKPLLSEGFITQLELDQARQAVEKAREDLELLETKHRTYLNYTRPADVEGARASVANGKEAQREAQSATSYRLSQAQAAFEVAGSKAAELEARLAENKKNLAACEIRATLPGIVIYREVFFGSERRRVQVGDQVWPNQPLVLLPELSQMVVETRVRETDIHKVEKNQKVVVIPDAYPDLKLEGKVHLVGTLAQEEKDGAGRSRGKYFQITVLLDGGNARLRPGMSARVELLVDHLPHVLSVPLEAVFERAGRRYCYVLRRGAPEVREVLTGRSNDDYVVVEAGLSAGEQVLLNDPLDASRPLGASPSPGLFDGAGAPAPR